MHPIKGSLLAGVLALVCAWPSFAASPTEAQLIVKNGSGTPVAIDGQTDANSNFHYRDVMEGLNGAAPQPWSVNGSGWGAVMAAVGAFPDGWDSTQGAQADAVCGTDTGPCSVIALLKRDNARLTSILSAIGSPMQATGGSVTALSSTTSVANANITGADSGTTSTVGQSSVNQVTGSPTAGSFIDWSLAGYSAVAVSVSGTFSATGQFETSADGVVYAPATAKILGSALTSGSVTGKGVFRIDTAGMTHLRLRATAYASGTLTANATATNAAGLVQVLNPVRLTDSTGAEILGTTADSAWSGSGNASLAALLKALATPATPVRSTSLEACHVLKNAAGVLYSFQIRADSTLAASAWDLMFFDATSAPADGAVTPVKDFGYPSSTISPGGTLATGGIAFATGIVACVSTTGPFTKTASAHAFIEGDVR